MWKKILESGELLSYEKSMPHLNVRIEARKENSENPKWIVYLKYYNDTLNFTEEYSCENKEQVNEIINCLQTSKLKTLKELVHLKLLQTKDIHLNLARDFRDYNLEKWSFSINKDSVANHLIYREGDFNEIEVILNEKYMAIEERVVNKLVSTLGLANSDFKTKITIYYYKNESKYYLEENYLENLSRN